MHRIALVVAFTVGTIGLAFGQASTAEDHSAHHPAQNSATSSQAQPGSSSAGATSGEPRAMMQGMMQMMQGMQGMMGKMHQQAQSDQKQTSQALAMQNCPMMSHGSAAPSDSTTMQAMMQMMQGMMQMMQSQMQSGQGHGSQ